MLHDDSPMLTGGTMEQVEPTSAELAQSLRTLNVSHPVLNRIRARLIGSKGLEAAITSFDRMHHRHNRS